MPFLSFTAPLSPVPAGVSAENQAGTAGTHCLPVIKNSNIYSLSCTHTYARFGEAMIGESILHPAPFDGGFMPDYLFGVLSEFIPMIPVPGTNIAEGAIAMVDPASVVFRIQGYGPYERVIGECEYGKRVSKVGRTTGVTYGYIQSCSYIYLSPPYKGKEYEYQDQIFCISDRCPVFVRPGDSGSPLILVDSSRPVGMVIAGSDFTVVASKLSNISLLLGISI